jgi:hypothetical protein
MLVLKISKEGFKIEDWDLKIPILQSKSAIGNFITN